MRCSDPLPTERSMKSRSTRGRPISLKVASSTTTKSSRVSTKVPSRPTMAARRDAGFMASLPLDYASGFHPQFGATLMPGLVRSHEHAAKLNASPFMQDIKGIIERGGVHVLSDAWLAGAFGAKDKCIRKPEDAAGLKVR